MKALILNVKKREVMGKKMAALREKGIIPAIVYGHQVLNVNVQVSIEEFKKIFREVGESAIFDLAIGDDKPRRVIIKDVQKDPVRGDFLHIDFYEVSMHEKLQTQIPLKFIGIAPAVKTFGGVFVTQKESVNVKCFPQDLVPEIPVDISTLVNLEDTIKIRNIIVPGKIEILDSQDDIVASVIVTKEEVAEVKATPAQTEAAPATPEKKDESSVEQKPLGNQPKQEHKKPS